MKFAVAQDSACHAASFSGSLHREGLTHVRSKSHCKSNNNHNDSSYSSTRNIDTNGNDSNNGNLSRSLLGDPRPSIITIFHRAHNSSPPRVSL